MNKQQIIKEHMRKLGAKGGRSVSEKKLKAIKGNLAKAQAARRKKVEDQP